MNNASNDAGKGNDRLMETYRGVVHQWHCDHMGHLNVTWYTSMFEEASWQLLAMLGITPGWMRSTGLGMVSRDQRVSFLRELHAGDVVFVRSAILEVRGKALRFAHELVDASTGEVCAIAHFVAVHFDRQTRGATPLPGPFAERARARLTHMVLPWADLNAELDPAPLAQAA